MSKENYSHDLSAEFPEFKEKIHELKMNNNHFKVIFEKYQELDKAIYRSETRIDLLSNEQEEVLRKQRLKIKDELYQLLRVN
jgi:uncharacterized protein YdcH (DUF465 family)